GKPFTFDSRPELEVSIKTEPLTFDSHAELDMSKPVKFYSQPEVSIKIESNDSDRSEKRNRKQSQPRKIEKMEDIDSNLVAIHQQNVLNRIRDKHLLRMISLIGRIKSLSLSVKNARAKGVKKYKKSPLSAGDVPIEP
ncbi:hypothetical protein Bhyg_00840, partial [Pseudolycoriella hygida]